MTYSLEEEQYLICYEKGSTYECINCGQHVIFDCFAEKLPPCKSCGHCEYVKLY